MNLLPLADIGHDLGPIIACLGVFMIPIVAILTAHQRKMALIIHGTQRDRQVEQDQTLTNEVRELKQLVYQQAIAIDQISTKLDLVSSGSVQQRLTG